MRRILWARVQRTTWSAAVSSVCVAVVFAALAISGPSARAIEMFTYFGDGSRIGLPSLEVPIEAYPGIPLRSDRIRARRRAMQSQGAPVRVGPPGGITIRTMPQGQPMPVPRSR